jgi:hypothetical protein
VNPIPELKPIACKVRTLGWKPKINIRMPGGTLTFNKNEHRPGLFAYGKRHDYFLRIESGIGRVGKWAEGLLYDGEPDWSLCECMAAVPGGTTTELIRLAEEWEADQCNS